MDTFEATRQELLALTDRLHGVITMARILPGQGATPFETWHKARESMRRQVEEGILRVAVVGAIKSGKSTLVNSWFGGDYLKRGAGVVTSMLTRVRSGDRLSASLTFKSWEEIAQEIAQATVLFPSFEPPADGVDIRREADREKLRRALAGLGADQLLSQDARNLNAVLLASYLEGYPKVAPYLEKGQRHAFEARDFAGHRPFVADETMAVYLKDLAITMAKDGALESQVELADCQGSDSPNPLHLAMIEDYLYKTHLVIYVISSRMGVRRADIRFFHLLRELGLLDNMYVVVNADMSDHEGLEDCLRVAGRVKEEVGLVRKDPGVFCFSALHSLFCQTRETLPPKDQARLCQWEADPAFTGYSQAEKDRFTAALRQRLTRDRLSLLLRSHSERLGIICGGIGNFARLHQELLTRDAGTAHAIYTELKRQQDGIRQIRLMIRHTIDGALQKGRKEVGKEVDRFFDFKQGEVMRGIREFVLAKKVEEPDLANFTVSFSAKVYQAFQDLKTAVDTYMAETVNPRLLALVRTEEARIVQALVEIAEPYDAMVKDAMGRYMDAIRSMGVELSGLALEPLAPLDPSRVREDSGLEIPPLTSAMRQGQRVRAEAVLRLSAYRAASGLRELFTRRKNPGGMVADQRRALEAAVWRMKEETITALWAHFMDYRENLKFQYLYKMLDRAAEKMEERLADRFQLYTEGMAETAGLLSGEESAKEKARRVLAEMEEEVREISVQVALVRARVEGLGPE
jgi:GTPase SAR1 family protein